MARRGHGSPLAVRDDVQLIVPYGLETSAPTSAGCFRLGKATPVPASSTSRNAAPTPKLAGRFLAISWMLVLLLRDERRDQLIPEPTIIIEEAQPYMHLLPE
jgi:hypothetical protein